MNTEAELLSAVCKNKDISTLLADNVDEIFTSHKDIWDSLKAYYYKFKAVPEEKCAPFNSATKVLTAATSVIALFEIDIKDGSFPGPKRNIRQYSFADLRHSKCV